jgi:hypothetical protein
MMRMTDSETCHNQDAGYVQASANPLVAQSAGESVEISGAMSIVSSYEIEIIINWEVARREARKVTDTQFFRDLMANIIAPKRHSA